VSRRRAGAIEIACLAAALAVAGWARSAALDRYLASDELRWLCRSVNFQVALAEGDWRGTFQVGHPGVLTMWLGTLALPLARAGQWRELCATTKAGSDLSDLDDIGREGTLQTSTPLVFQARRGVAVATWVALLGLYLLMRIGAGLGPAPALGGWALVAFDPFLLAHSKVLHVDALLSLAAAMSVVALAAAERAAPLRDRLRSSVSTPHRRAEGKPSRSNEGKPLWGLVSLAPIGASQFGARGFSLRASTRGIAGLIRQSLTGEDLAPADIAPGRWDRRWLLVSGALAGLAMLSKVAGFVLGPFAVAWLAWRAWPRRAWRSAARAAVAWSLAALVAYVVLWPAMWVDPLGTLFKDCPAEPPPGLADPDRYYCEPGVLHKAAVEGGTPHESGNFFMGRAVEDPGPLYYPVAAAFRLTPLGLIGGLLALAGLATARLRPAAPRGRETGVLHAPTDGAGGLPTHATREGVGGGAIDRTFIGVLLAWALLFVVFITLGPKKLDRYVLPALVALNLAGGVAIVRATAGLADVARRSAAARHRLAQAVDVPGGRFRAASVAAIAAVALVAVQGYAMARAHVYPLAYYNPLLGGAAVASRAILIGWGEGYDLAADWLNKRPEPVRLEAAVRGVANFAPLFLGRTRSGEGYRSGRTDYFVFYIGQVQRGRFDDVLGRYYFGGANQAPDYVGRIGDLDYVWIFSNWTVPLLEGDLDRRARAGDVLLVDGEAVFAKQYAGSLPLLRYWGHWRDAEMDEAIELLPAGWRRAWVVRYPDKDTDIALKGMDRVAHRRSTEQVADGWVELTMYVPEAP